VTEPPVGGVLFRELDGRSEPVRSEGSGPDVVVVSNLRRLELHSPAFRGVVLRYVGRGSENYHIGDQWHRLREGEMMLAAQPHQVLADVRDTTRAGTLGLCVYIDNPGPLDGIIDSSSPVIIRANSARVGQILHDNLQRLIGSPNKSRDASGVVDQLRCVLPAFASEVGRQLDAFPSIRSATKLHALRKVSIAREYLHAVLDRPVSLEELAIIAGVSPFHLQRMFKQCIGKTPAAYHRELRLCCAAAERAQRKSTFTAVADRYGFAGASSFSHAYRRAFGTAPSDR
jgi:AraC-like DNA-binding protein